MTLTTLKPLQFIFLGDKELFEGPESLVFSAVIIPDKASLMNSVRPCALYTLGSTTGSELVFSAVTELTWIDGVWTRKNP